MMKIAIFRTYDNSFHRQMCILDETTNMMLATYCKVLHSRLKNSEHQNIIRNNVANNLIRVLENISISKNDQSTTDFITSEGALNISLLENKLNLEFLEEEPEDGNLCYAQSSELREDFKTWFTALDLLDFLCATLYNQEKNISEKPHFSRINSPENQDEFLHLVARGRAMREDINEF